MVQTVIWAWEVIWSKHTLTFNSGNSATIFYKQSSFLAISSLEHYIWVDSGALILPFYAHLRTSSHASNSPSVLSVDLIISKSEVFPFHKPCLIALKIFHQPLSSSSNNTIMLYPTKHNYVIPDTWIFYLSSIMQWILIWHKLSRSVFGSKMNVTALFTVWLMHSSSTWPSNYYLVCNVQKCKVKALFPPITLHK